MLNNNVMLLNIKYTPPIHQFPSLLFRMINNLVRQVKKREVGQGIQITMA
jgi:hypothetical protein